MPSFKIIDRRRGAFREGSALLEERMDIFHLQFGRGFVEEVVALSPVDSGAYMDGHQVTAGRQGVGSTTSHGRPRKQPRDPFASAAIERLFSQLAATTKVEGYNLTNVALHGIYVEYGGPRTPAYLVYTTARARTPDIASRALQMTLDLTS